ncbi:MAG: glucosamine-6-phosphate deaminase [Clostridia bacterium]|nr:glucosamine-6-phosphate deaminase [Clostridia bacterium]
MIRTIVCSDYAEMSRRAADIVEAEMLLKPDCVLGLATGSTPEGMYAELVKDNRDGKISFAAVRTVNLDEYYPLAPDNDQSYRYFMNYHLFDKVDIDKANTNVPDGLAADTVAEGQRYEALIDSMGGIDLQVLGIGRNGHIGFNEPGASLDTYTHCTDLTPSTIEANSRNFASIDDVPKQAMTMGIGSIFKARRIIVMASGKEKADAVACMLAGELDTNCPATLLNLHRDVILIADRAALGE